MVKIEILKDELDALIQSANELKVDRKEVAKNSDISHVYLMKIISGDRCYLDSDENKELLQKIIIQYRSEINKMVNELKVKFTEVKK